MKNAVGLLVAVLAIAGAVAVLKCRSGDEVARTLNVAHVAVGADGGAAVMMAVASEQPGMGFELQYFGADGRGHWSRPLWSGLAADGPSAAVSLGPSSLATVVPRGQLLHLAVFDLSGEEMWRAALDRQTNSMVGNIGIAISRKLIYVADGARLVAIDLESRQEKWRGALSGPFTRRLVAHEAGALVEMATGGITLFIDDGGSRHIDSYGNALVRGSTLRVLEPLPGERHALADYDLATLEQTAAIEVELPAPPIELLFWGQRGNEAVLVLHTDEGLTGVSLPTEGGAPSWIASWTGAVPYTHPVPVAREAGETLHGGQRFVPVLAWHDEPQVRVLDIEEGRWTAADPATEGAGKMVKAAGCFHLEVGLSLLSFDSTSGRWNPRVELQTAAHITAGNDSIWMVASPGRVKASTKIDAAAVAPCTLEPRVSRGLAVKNSSQIAQ